MRCGSGSFFRRRRLLCTARVVNKTERQRAAACSRCWYLRINGSDPVADSSNLSIALGEKISHDKGIVPAAKAASARILRRRARKRIETRNARALSRGAAANEHNEVDIMQCSARRKKP